MKCNDQYSTYQYFMHACTNAQMHAMNCISEALTGEEVPQATEEQEGEAGHHCGGLGTKEYSQLYWEIQHNSQRHRKCKTDSTGNCSTVVL
jgi:hypothetical protein